MPSNQNNLIGDIEYLISYKFDGDVPFTWSDDAKMGASILTAVDVDLADYKDNHEVLGVELIYNYYSLSSPVKTTCKFYQNETNQLLWEGNVYLPEGTGSGGGVRYWIGKASWELLGPMTVRIELTVNDEQGLGGDATLYMNVTDSSTPEIKANLAELSLYTGPDIELVARQVMFVDSAQWADLYEGMSLDYGNRNAFRVEWKNRSGSPVRGRVKLSVKFPSGTFKWANAVSNQDELLDPEQSIAVQFEGMILDEEGDYEISTYLEHTPEEVITRPVTFYANADSSQLIIDGLSFSVVYPYTENLTIGTHVLTATKSGFEPIEFILNVLETGDNVKYLYFKLIVPANEKSAWDAFLDKVKDILGTIKAEFQDRFKQFSEWFGGIDFTKDVEGQWNLSVPYPEFVAAWYKLLDNVFPIDADEPTSPFWVSMAIAGGISGAPVSLVDDIGTNLVANFGDDVIYAASTQLSDDIVKAGATAAQKTASMSFLRAIAEKRFVAWGLAKGGIWEKVALSAPVLKLLGLFLALGIGTHGIAAWGVTDNLMQTANLNLNTLKRAIGDSEISKEDALEQALMWEEWVNLARTYWDNAQINPVLNLFGGGLEIAFGAEEQSARNMIQGVKDAAAGADIGYFYISSSPTNAKVYLNDEFVFEYTNTTISVPADVEQKITLKLQGYDDWSEYFTVTGTQTENIHHDFTGEPPPPPGTWLQITTTPSGANIFIDGVDTYKNSPANIEVEPGSHDLRLTLSGYDPATGTYTIAEGETQTVAYTFVTAGEVPEEKKIIELEPLTAAYTAWKYTITARNKVTGEILRAKIIIDDFDTGSRTTGYIYLAPSASYALRLEAYGFMPYESVITTSALPTA